MAQNAVWDQLIWSGKYHAKNIRKALKSGKLVISAGGLHVMAVRWHRSDTFSWKLRAPSGREFWIAGNRKYIITEKP